MTDEEFDAGTEARRRVFRERTAALATLSANEAVAGFPFGSVVPYVLDERGRPLILVSDIAEHTRNLRADGRASLLVRPRAEDDPQAAWRATLLGRMRRIDDPGGAAMARYVARVPGAGSYSGAHDFAFWRMDVARVRFIGGFGRIHWVEADDYLRPEGHAGFAEAAPAIIEHMNEDHADALVDYCRGLRGVTPASATLTAVEAGGFFVRAHAPDGLHFFPFDSEIEADQAREAFVGLLRRARDGC